MTWTLLHDACENPQRQGAEDTIIQLAHQHPESVLNVDEHGSTPLHVLCWGNPHSRAVEALLEACPQAASDTDYFGDTPLHVACSCPHADKHLVQTLLKECPTAVSLPNREGLLPLHMACRYAPENEGVIGLLIEAYPYALHARIKVSECKMQVGVYFVTLLSLICFFRCVSATIQMGDPAPRKPNASRLCGKENDHALIDPSDGMKHKDSIQLRYMAVSKQVRDGAYPLHMAVQANAPLAVIEMMIKEADEILMKTNKYGETPLHLALKEKEGRDDSTQEELVQLLLRNHASAVLRVRDVGGNLPIHVAVMHGCSVHVAKDLLEIWLDAIHEVNEQDMTPMELAVKHGKCSDEVLRLLALTDSDM